MASNFKIKRSAVSGRRPTLSNIQLGELALNTYDGYLFAERDTGGVGIGTTVSLLTPWIENFGGGSIYYNNSVGIGTNQPIDILDVNGTLRTQYLNVVGISTLASAGDITTTGGDLYVGGNLYVGDDIVFDEFTARNATLTENLNVSGVATFGNNVNIAGTVGIGTRIDIVPYDTLSEGTLSFEGSAGQLFSITNNLTTGSIFSVNDVSGIPSIDVDADGTVLIAPYGSTEYVGIGTISPSEKLDVNGTIKTSQLNVTGVSTFASNVDINASVDIQNNLNVSGVSTFGGNVYLGDNDVLNFGDGNDLQIYHNGSDSLIRDTGTGDLYIDGGNVFIRSNLNENAISANSNGSVELYYDNNKKFETSGVGVTVYGDLYLQGGVSIGFNNDSSILYFNDATNQTRAGYWTNKDGFEVRGDGNNKLNVVLQTGNLEISQNAHISGILGIGNTVYAATDVGIGTDKPTAKLDVNGSFAATTKSFVIDHPTKEGMKLRYGSLEGPENGVYVRGKTDGFVIDLPDYWTGLVDEDSITASLTAIGKAQTLWVKDIKDNKVFVGSKCSTVKYFYTIFGERKDVEKLEVEF